MSYPIATVLSFCSNDWRFFKRAIDGARPFSAQIIVTVCDHFFDGSEENYALLEKIYSDYPDLLFLEFSFDPYSTYRYYSTCPPDHPLWRHEWHNTGRYLSFFFADDGIDYFYFCDADEITDADRFCAWLAADAYQNFDAIRFSCRWYFRKACYQSLQEDDMCLLVKKSAIDPEMFWSEHERMGIYLNVKGPKTIHMKGLDGRPLIDHYSWVRTESELNKKFETWGHYWERDWKHLIQEEFASSFKGVDFIRGYQYTEVDPNFDPLKVDVPVLKPIRFLEHVENVKLFDNVKRVSCQEMFRKQLQYQFRI